MTQSTEAPGSLTDDPVAYLAQHYHLTKVPQVSGADEVYLALLAAGYASTVESGTPVKRLARATGRSSNLIKAHLAKARARGYLSEAMQGRSYGRLTDAGRKILEGK